jgi:spermidine/putrescine transport system substrate-binding protein
MDDRSKGQWLERFTDGWLWERMNTPVSRRTFLKGAGIAAASVAAAPLIAACGGDSSSSATAEASASPEIGGELRFLDVMGYADEEAAGPFIEKYGINLQELPTGSNEEIVTKLAAGGTRTYSLASPNIAYVGQMVKGDLLQPLDFGRIPSTQQFLPWVTDLINENMFDGKNYYAPFIWGDSPLVYNENFIEAPIANWMDCKSDEYKGKIFMVDDPSNNITIWSRALGYNPPNLTQEELDETTKFLIDFKKNYVRMFGGTWGDLSDLMIRGDIWLCASGSWAAVPQMINDKGGKAAGCHPAPGDFMWMDTLAIPKEAPNPDTAYAWIDWMTSAEPQKILATKLISGTVNAEAVELLDPAAKEVYNYDDPTANSPLLLLPSNEPGEYATLDEWYKAWQTVKAA